MTDKKQKKPPETDPDQSERFRKAVRDLEAVGELNPTEADARLDGVVRKAATRPPSEH